MSDVAVEDPREPEPSASAKVRTALVSTRRLALLFPEPELGRGGQPDSSWFDRLAAGLRHRRRLAATRLWFRFQRLDALKMALRSGRMRLRLMLMRLRHGRLLAKRNRASKLDSSR